MTTTRANIVFACYSAACRPPTSGGTGGSLKGQHVANRANAASIMRSGFDINKGAAWDRSFGDGVYFSVRGDEKARRFYQRQGGRTKKDSVVLKAGLRLKNPATFNVKDHSEFRLQAAEKLGGVPAVKAKLQDRYDRAQAIAKRVNDEEGLGLDLSNGIERAIWWDVPDKTAHGRLSAKLRAEVPEIFNNNGTKENDPFGELTWYKRMINDDDVTGMWRKLPRGYSDQSGSIESRILGNMLRDEGHDGLIINTKAWAGVGGTQIVVFDPKAIKLVRNLPASAQPRVPAGSPKGGQWTRLTGKVRAVLTDDLRKAPYKGNCNPMTGHCYVASEAMYHALGGKEAGWTPHQITHEGSPHWFLKHKSGAIVDPTADQFKTPVPYDKARGKGFLTRQPSKRAKEVMRRAGLSDKSQ